MHKHTIDLLERLLAATRADRITWAQMPAKTAFSYLAGEYVILIDSTADHTSFHLADTKGKVLEQADADKLGKAKIATGSSALEVVQSLYAIAKRQTMGTDIAIASVLEHLQSLSLDDAPEILPDVSTVKTNLDEAPPFEEPAPEEDDLEDDDEEYEEQEDSLGETEDTPDSGDGFSFEEDLLLSPEEDGADDKKKKTQKRSGFGFFGRKK